MKRAFAPDNEGALLYDREKESGKGHVGQYGSALEQYLSTALKTPLLSAEEERELFCRFKKGDREAFLRLVHANARLVVNIAKKYNHDSRVELIDLIAEGNVGLVHAVERYDQEKGFRLSTYAVWWIRDHVQKCLQNNARTVRLPIHIQKRYAAYRRLLDSCSEGKPSSELVMESLGLSQEHYDDIASLNPVEVSVDVPLGGSDTSPEWHDVLTDNNGSCEVLVTQERMMQSTLNQVLKEVLTARERAIISLRFEKEMSLGDVGKSLSNSVSAERVRQLENKALRRLQVYMEEQGFSLQDFVVQS
ncbi:RNA polymerase sigma factor RpoD/SigA [Alteromonas sp. 14N.309.X.WAT.G.H12]|uniref:sigma-70 family RNA polymerase sigma factor n=1 Tax=Alteromonas sp. 14N.309.X.WAT.G.H12 TaxID=3120824 RepID=UPI002FCE9FFA